jgi:hypothetical protein
MLSGADLFISLIPLKNSDHLRIARTKSNPLQRVRISPAVCLNSLAAYIRRLATAPDSEPPLVNLFVDYRKQSLQLPLSLTVSDFLAITNQVTEIRYGFDEVREERHVVRPLQRVSVEFPEPQVSPVQFYPAPSVGDSLGPIYPAGFPLFGDSFTLFPPLFEPVRNQNGETQVDDALSLRYGLEQLLQK